ncbi:methylated-DNA--[protein]-cysteine S-methyltransferase [Helicobacter sp. faydin-H20]|uniref:methylated-DNA--[protein]-cysteine S-methyltransferase n=1 Tax=Helicobacter anatolicus TaxID=2905874 RepID=UPI001E3ADB25|nr:methylated-DNA--[protein]-cysteine S-methyltransferase [Helicobacter anatolicus]MCE3036831.1 methylated-DNA--[protein]-cysteine S-methyltransferase [Helicobacter anatolicus]
MYYTNFLSPLGSLTITADSNSIITLDFTDDLDLNTNFPHLQNQENAILTKAKKWLETYFDAKEPNFSITMRFIGSDFQKEVWDILCKIPFGKTISYGEIAQIIAKRRNIKRMSAQAVGRAVGSNKIAIIVPCHRVIGANGNLVGYASGLDKKLQLLKLEGALK